MCLEGVGQLLCDRSSKIYLENIQQQKNSFPNVL